MSSDHRLQELKDKLDGTIKRIETVQKGSSLSSRLRGHLRLQVPNLANVVLAGCIFAVAFGRLQLQNQQELERREWEDERERLKRKSAELQQEVLLLKVEDVKLRHNLRSVLDSGGWRLAPVAQQMRELLSYEGQFGGQQADGECKAAAGLSGGDTQEDARPPRLMI